MAGYKLWFSEISVQTTFRLLDIETEHNADTETLVDDFVLFYIAGM